MKAKCLIDLATPLVKVSERWKVFDIGSQRVIVCALRSAEEERGGGRMSEAAQSAC
jgi:hypothetical protein